MAASQPFGFSCKGGLNTNISEIEMLKQPGIATELMNFEVDPDGGYRRINGFTDFGGDDAARPNSTAAVLGIKTYADGVIVCSGTNIYFSNDGATWLQINRASVAGGGDNYTAFTGRSALARTAQGQSSISIFEGSKSIYGEVVICDGANKPYYFYMTGAGALNTRTFFAAEITVSGTDAPAVGTIHNNFLVVSGVAAKPNTVTNSHLLEVDNFTGAGANEVVLSDKVVGLKSFRGDCIIFCQNSIHKFVNMEDKTNAAIVPITKNVGCLDGNSIQEIGGDLVFLSPDGIRTLAGTARIGDVELTSVSRNIQRVVSDITRSINTFTITSVVLRSKSQYRLYYNNSSNGPSVSKGIIGTFTGQGFEWSECQGIEAPAIDNGFLHTGVEQIVHGDGDGYIYNHDTGNAFIHAGSAANVNARYQTPYLDFGDMGTRKTLQYAKLSMTPDKFATGFAQPKLQVLFDFEDTNIQQPPIYQLPIVRSAAEFGLSLFNASYFGSADNPLIRQTIQGSFYSSNFKVSSEDQLSPYTINGLYLNYVPAGRRQTMAGTSYTRQSTIADGNIISASLFNNEFNQILNAFAYASTGTTGHQHDGGAGEGGNIAKIGDQDFLNKIEVDSTNNRIGLFVQVSSGTVEQVRIQDGAIVPVTDSDVDLGTSSVRFKDAFVDSVTTTTITAAGTTNIVTGVVTGDLTLTGADYNIVFDASASELKFNDNADLLIGTGGDLRIYHDGSNSRIKEQGTGNLYITADNSMSFGSSNGAQSLVVNGSQGLQALAGGQSRMTVDFGGVNIPDNVKLNFGADDDLQIFHDGNDSRITDTGTGNLYIIGSSTIKLLSNQTEYASFGTAVELSYNNSKKFETTNTGVAISGNASLSGAATAQAFNANASIDTPVLEVTTLKARDGSAAGSIANSTGVVTLGSAVLTTADINGGTADNVVIGGSTAAAGTFTTGTIATADINGGAIDGTIIGAAATAAGSFTTLNSSSTITSTRTDNGVGLHLISTDAGAASGPTIKFERDSASPADDDITGIVNFTANDDGDNNTTFVQFLTKITDASNGSESGHFEIKTQQGGTFRPAITVDTIGGQAEVNINRFSADIDFRVEGSGQPALLFAEAGTNRIGIKTATPAVELEVNGGAKFTTAEVTGLLSGSDITLTDASPKITFIDSDGTNQTTEQVQAGGSFVTTVRNNTSHGAIDFKSNNGTNSLLRFRVATDGDFNFYKNDGSTIGAKWDAPNGRLGIGTTSPATALSVAGKITTTEGIYLGGTAAANLLDEYEEGNFDSGFILSDASSSGNNASFGTVQTQYIRIGRLVTCTVRLLNINTSGMTGGNSLHVIGLPFKLITPHVVSFPVYSSQVDMGENTATGVFGLTVGNSTRAQLRVQFEGGGTSTLTVDKLTSGSASLIFTIHYMTDI